MRVTLAAAVAVSLLAGCAALPPLGSDNAACAAEDPDTAFAEAAGADRPTTFEVANEMSAEIRVCLWLDDAFVGVVRGHATGTAPNIEPGPVVNVTSGTHAVRAVETRYDLEAAVRFTAADANWLAVRVWGPDSPRPPLEIEHYEEAPAWM